MSTRLVKIARRNRFIDLSLRCKPPKQRSIMTIGLSLMVNDTTSSKQMNPATNAEELWNRNLLQSSEQRTSYKVQPMDRLCYA